MNKERLFDYMLDRVEKQVEIVNKALSEQEGWDSKIVDEHDPATDDLNAQMLELYTRREGSCIYPPSDLPRNADRMVAQLRKLYRDDVSKVSLVLHHHFPDKFLFYRVSRLEEEIFQGFEYFADIVEELDFDFEKVRRAGFEQYLAVNESLLALGRRVWPNVKNLQFRLECFVYDNLAQLFLETSDYNRYWICNTQYEYWKDRNEFESDADKTIEWSGRKDMRAGDIVFLYCSAPVKAVTDVYEVVEDPVFDPGGAWDGFWVTFAHLCEIPGHIPFGKMRKDPVLGQWSVVRRNFQGVVTEAVPHACYNRFIDFIPQDTRKEFGFSSEPVADIGSSGQFTSEEEFEDAVVEPILKKWGLQYRRQSPCKCYFGTQRITGYVDFLVENQAGDLTLFEDKLKILSPEQLQAAVNQARSYALMLGLPSFVVASPEGMKLYSLEAGKEMLVAEMHREGTKGEEDEFFSRLLQLQRGT